MRYIEPIGLFFLFFLHLPSSATAQNSIEQTSLQKNKSTGIPFNIGFCGSFGVGLNYWNTGLVTDKDEKIKISPGGGIGFGFTTNIPLKGYWLIGNEFTYQFTALIPQVDNGKGNFRHLNEQVSLKRAIPVSDDGQAIAIGAGVDISFNGRYEFEMKKIPNGADNIYRYKTTAGPCVLVEYLAWFDRNSLGGIAGIKYTYLKYNLDNFSSNGYDVPVTDAIRSGFPSQIVRPDGSGIDLYLGIIYSFR